MKWLTKRNDNLSLDTFKNEIDSFFDDFFELKPVSLFETRWAPSIDVSEDETSINVKAEMPGMSEKDINVSIEKNVLTITGEKREEREEKKGKNRVLTERKFGSFRRSITLPEGIKTDETKADFKNGVLTMDIPKDKAKAPKKIEINVH